MDPQTELVGLTNNASTAAGLPMKSVAYASIENPKVKPFLRSSTRWDYAVEYIGWYVDQYRFAIMAMAAFAIGFWSLHYFAPVGLLLFAMAGRYMSLSRLDHFIWCGNGPNRSLVLID